MKVLILRFSSIGDLVLTTPVLRCLKQQQAAEVHLLVKKRFASVLQDCPYIDRLHVFDHDIGAVVPALVEEGFDRVIDLHKNLRSWRIRMALGVPAQSFQKLNVEKWLLVNFKMNRLPDVHIVDRYLAAVSSLGVTYDGQGLEHFINPDDEVNVEREYGVRSYLAVAVGAAHATKRIPEAQLAELCAQLPWPVLLLGGPDDIGRGERIAGAAGNHVQNTCGQLRLQQSASLIRQARVVLSPDTGLMHIAAAFRKPLLSVWGNTVPEFGMYPFYPDTSAAHESVMLQVPNLPCRPCSKIGYEVCPKGHFRCMTDITLEAMKHALLRLWG